MTVWRSGGSAGRGADEGAALVIALVFVTVMSLVVAAALSYTTTSLRNSSRRYEPARERLYAADAAMKAAALYIAANPDAGVAPSGSTCAPTLTYGTVAGQAITVQPCPKANSFVTITPSSFGMQLLASGVNTTALTLSQGASLQVNGDLKVNGKVAVGNNSLIVRNGSLTAANCTISQSGSITSDGTAVAQNDTACKTGSTAVDPAYVSGLGSIYPADATSSCSDGVLTIEPGLWTSAVVANLTSCATIHLAPGIHVLDSVAWTVDRRVVGGALANGVTKASLSTGTLGRLCDDDVDGVTLVVAGSTSITFSGTGSSPAEVELCGRTVSQSGGGTPKIALFGPPSALSFGSSGTLTGTAASAGAGWTNGANAATINSSSATYSNLPGGSTSSAMTITGYAGTIPAGSTLSANVAISRSGRPSTMTVKVRNSGSSSDNCTGSASVGTSLSPTTSVSLTCSAALVTPLSVLVSVTSGGSSSQNTSFTLDGVSLSYSDVKTIGASADGATAVDAGTNGGELYVKGEVYLPSSHMILTQSKVRSALTTGGLVLKSLEMKTNASSTTVPVLASANGSYSDGDLELTTSIGGTPWMGCRVEFNSQGYFALPTLQGCTIPR